MTIIFFVFFLGVSPSREGFFQIGNVPLDGPLDEPLDGSLDEPFNRPLDGPLDGFWYSPRDGPRKNSPVPGLELVRVPRVPGTH